MRARGRFSMALAVLSIVSFSQALDRTDPRAPGSDKAAAGGPKCHCGKPLRVESGNQDFAMCGDSHLNFLGPDGLPEAPGAAPRA